MHFELWEDNIKYSSILLYNALSLYTYNFDYLLEFKTESDDEVVLLLEDRPRQRLVLPVREDVVDQAFFVRTLYRTCTRQHIFVCMYWMYALYCIVRISKLISLYVYMYVCMPVRMYAYMYVYTYVRMYVYVRMHACMHCIVSKKL